jgi:cytochrome c-type biogenesis protein CcmH/NrfF
MRSVRLASIVCLTSLLLAERAHAQADRADAPAADEAELARSARVETILRVALDRNQDLAESQARASAAEARTQAAARLPDLELKY